MSSYYSIHTHIFNEACIPVRFHRSRPKSFIGRMIHIDDIRETIVEGLKVINPFNAFDKGNLLARMVVVNRHETQDEVWQEIVKNYTDVPDMRFVVLPLDFDYMEAGASLINYPTQLYELIRLKHKYKDKIIPFVCADPRRYQGAELTNFVASYIQKHGFGGVQLCPALGFYPFDPSLFELYKFAEEYSIPVITDNNIGEMHLRGSLMRQQLAPAHLSELDSAVALARDLRSDKIDASIPHIQAANLPRVYVRQSMDVFRHNFTDPAAYREVLNLFPRLKLCFTCFRLGSESNGMREKEVKRRNDEIIGLMSAFPNVYAEVSGGPQEEFMRNLIAVAECENRILWGTSSFYRRGQESDANILLRRQLESFDNKEELFEKIVSKNPGRFLSIADELFTSEAPK
jgi:predicted TIM-barrel fold metal-dependent hydrolase